MECKRSGIAPFLAVVAALSVLVPRAASGTVVDLAPGVRSWSLGLAGAADDSDPANAYFNPALIAWSEGAFATSGYGKLYKFFTDDIYTYNVGAGCSFEGGPPGAVRLRFGGAIRYSVLDWGEYEARDQDNNYLGVFHPRERSFSVTAGVGGTFRDAFHGSVGVSVKPWAYDDGHVKADDVSCDLGVMLKADFILGAQMRLSPSAGVSFLNLNSGDTFFRNNRYGMGVRLEGRSSRYFRERFDVEVPSFAVAAVYDHIADHSGAEYKNADARGLGAEISIAQVFFMRVGNYNSGEGSSQLDNSTYGVGLGMTMKRGWGRFDYASIEQGSISKRANKYGFSLGFAF